MWGITTAKPRGHPSQPSREQGILDVQRESTIPVRGVLGHMSCVWGPQSQKRGHDCICKAADEQTLPGPHSHSLRSSHAYGLKDLLSSLPQDLSFLWKIHSKESCLQRAPLKTFPGRGKETAQQSHLILLGLGAGVWQAGADLLGRPKSLLAGPVTTNWHY